MDDRTPNNADLRGERFGELVVQELLPERRNHQRQWWCICDCGRPAIRTTGYLVNVQKKGGNTSCRVCLVELTAGRSIDRRRHMKEALVLCWYEHGTLYSQDWEEYFTEKLRSDLLEADIGYQHPEDCDTEEILEKELDLPAMSWGQVNFESDEDLRQKMLLKLYGTSTGRVESDSPTISTQQVLIIERWLYHSFMTAGVDEPAFRRDLPFFGTWSNMPSFLWDRVVDLLGSKTIADIQRSYKLFG